MRGDSILLCGNLALVAATIGIFVSLYLWLITEQVVYMFIGLALIIAQVCSFMCFSSKYIDSEYDEDEEKEKLR